MEGLQTLEFTRGRRALCGSDKEAEGITVSRGYTEGPPKDLWIKGLQGLPSEFP
jgi:hypothetical protein